MAPQKFVWNKIFLILQVKSHVVYFIKIKPLLTELWRFLGKTENGAYLLNEAPNKKLEQRKMLYVIELYASSSFVKAG